MSSLNALSVAVEVASRKRDDARKVLQDTLAAEQAARAQLNQLEDYARETESRWGMKADTAMQPEVMYHHYQFMNRLGHAASIRTVWWVINLRGCKPRSARCWMPSFAWPACARWWRRGATTLLCSSSAGIRNKPTSAPRCSIAMRTRRIEHGTDQSSFLAEHPARPRHPC